MYNLLFVCHGNICRSPTAEFYMKALVKRAGLEKDYTIASAAAHTDAIGESVYPPARRLLAEHGIDCSGKRARLLTKRDYINYDLLIGMDDANLRDMRGICGGDPEGRIHSLMEYAGRPHDSVADPWYTRDFEKTWLDVSEGCQGLLEKLSGIVVLDFSQCSRISHFYDIMRRKLRWEDWYGSNLDALYDILTGLPHKKGRFMLLMPGLDAPREIREYADKIYAVFAEAREEG